MPNRAGFAGIHAVLYAFFDRDGMLDRHAMAMQVETVIAEGVDGVAVLGLATEVHKLSASEQRAVIDWAAEDVAGRVPLSVTVAGNSIAAQRDMGSHAVARGADLVILQPPIAGSYGARTYLDFFAAVARELSVPWAIQNAPAYLGPGLDAADIAQLVAMAPGLAAIKAECAALDLPAVIEATGDTIAVLQGRGGLELPDCLRAGCHGFVLAPDVTPAATRIWQAWQAGDEAGTQDVYRDALPSIAFVMQSIETLICYGKRLFARRAGLTVHDRQPALAPSPFGEQCLHRLAQS
ncbi:MULTISPECIES: dihydrodipicolinate synthase family protein [unclassified Roseitalea]|uniref:dihydrodipicolinate synthase family protein n=1 Tax=unclassified Roseitalea TaxID=2639107 RepID=UPI00273F0673|nr:MULTISPECIES: dihydrodipicolinate synthase family protein [unclassified Roseitalea]